MSDTTTAVDEQPAATILSIDGLHVSYDSIAALQGISLDIDEGSFTAIIGPNGAGKSTLANTITGFKDYTQGSVQFKGVEVGEKKPPALVKEGLIFCTEAKDLFDFMSVRDNLELGAFARDVDVKKRRKLVYDIFPKLEERESQMANTMSGGEQQMLAIGRALMSDPEFLILDEPSLGLAPVVLEDISNGIEQIREEGVTMLLFEQNITFALKHADYIYLIENGELEREGTPEEMEDDQYIRSAYIGE
jgi:branched-chain amino acid transport system ATP-binding protein